METKTGEDITLKLGQPYPSNFRFQKAHLVDINVCNMIDIGHLLFEIQPSVRTCPEQFLPI